MRAPPIMHVIVALLLSPSAVVGQARNSNTSLPSTDKAAGFLTRLAGTWRFEMYAAGQRGPVASGQREMRLMGDSTKLAWTETFDSRSDTGVGILGHNAATDAWYVLGAYTHEPNPVVLIGRADHSAHTVTFDAAPSDVGLARLGTFVASELRLIDVNHFEWVSTDGRWRTVFTRAGHS